MNLCCLSIQQYEFSLENWVLTGLQSGFASHHWPKVSPSSGLLSSSPPYWMMFNTSQQPCLASRHGSDMWEPNPRQHSHSLSPAVLLANPVISDSEDDGVCATEKAKRSLSGHSNTGRPHPGTLHQYGQRKAQKAFVPDLLNPPTCLSSLPHQRRKNLRQCSLSVLETPKQQDLKTVTQTISLSSQRGLDTTASSMRGSAFHRSQTIDNHGMTSGVSNKHLFSCFNSVALIGPLFRNPTALVQQQAFSNTCHTG